MQIRTMEIDDLEQVMPIENANFTTPWSEVGFFTFLFREDALFLVAEEEETILGYMGILTVLDEGDITNVSVSAKARRKGVASALIQEMIHRMKEQGVLHIHLEVRESNEPARMLYEKFGFEQDGLRKDYYEEPKENAVLMSLHMQADG